MKISREWAMPNGNTFSIIPIKKFIDRYINNEMIVVDPFANKSKYGTITNDLNPDFDTNYHMDALDFLKILPDEMADIVLYDPPYSVRQISEVYKGIGIKITQKNTQSSYWSKQKDEISRIVKPNGICLSFGWNSNGIGEKRGFIKEELLLVAHGGAHNDTICLAEKKSAVKQYTIFQNLNNNGYLL